MTKVPRVRNRARPRICSSWEGESLSLSPFGRLQDCTVVVGPGANLGVGLGHSYIPSLPCRPLGWRLYLCVCDFAQAAEIFGQKGCIGWSSWNSETPLGLGIILVQAYPETQIWDGGWSLKHPHSVLLACLPLQGGGYWQFAEWPRVCFNHGKGYWSFVMTTEMHHSDAPQGRPC